ncbi:MAG: hypothetical protein HYW88_00745 [Candidatus Sungbacteria bacterium]|nr:hypothetical protein [Candidatus Sungbacteria bacterium]
MKERDFTTGLLVVLLKQEADENLFFQYAAREGITIESRIPGWRIYLVGVPVGREAEWKTKLENYPDICSVSLNFRISVV